MSERESPFDMDLLREMLAEQAVSDRRQWIEHHTRQWMRSVISQIELSTANFAVDPQRFEQEIRETLTKGYDEFVEAQRQEMFYGTPNQS